MTEGSANYRDTFMQQTCQQKKLGDAAAAADLRVFSGERGKGSKCHGSWPGSGGDCKS